MAGSVIKAWIDGKPLDEIEHYTVLEYLDMSKPIEIHKPDCQYVIKLVRINLGRIASVFRNHLVMGPLEKAEARAARIVAEEKRPSGWKRAPCCFDPNWKDTGPTLEEIIKLQRLNPPKEPEYYIKLHSDRSRYVEIHKFRCTTLRKELGECKPGQGIETGLMMNGPLEEVEKTAELNVKDNKYPGWKRAGCCFK